MNNCDECEHGEVSARRKERTQERIRILRKTISLLCNGDTLLIKKAMDSAENEIFGGVENNV